MTKDGREPWVRYLEHDIVNQHVPGLGYVLEVKIKIRQTDILAIVNVIGGGGPQVGFVGAKGLKHLAAKLSLKSLTEDVRWREDKYSKYLTT